MKLFDLIGEFVLEKKTILVLFVIGFAGIGAVLGILLLPEEWVFWRRLGGGLLGGLGAGFIVVTSRLTGAFQEEEENASKKDTNP